MVWFTKTALVLTSAFFFLGCAESNRGSSPWELSSKTLWERWSASPSSPGIYVKDSAGRPLNNARLLIGQARNAPFAGNYLTTDRNGFAPLPEAWQGALAVTIDAPGHIRATFFDQEPGVLQYQLRAADAQTRYELTGQTTNFGPLPRDGQVDFGLVIPALYKADLFSFDINTIVSPEMDTISIIGNRISIPSNLTLPRQSERYGLFPITLDKPNYRIYFPREGTHRVYAMRGQFPLSDVVDAIRAGTPFYELVNYMRFMSASVSDIRVQGHSTQANLPIDQVEFNGTRRVRAPQFRADEVMVAASLLTTGGRLVPTDVKKLDSNQTMPLVLPTGFNSRLLSVLRRRDEFTSPLAATSIALTPFVDNSSPEFIAFPQPFQVRSPGRLELEPPRQARGVNSSATYSLISRIETSNNGDSTVENKFRLWEAYSPGWVNQVQLPEWPGETAPHRNLRWEVTFVGQMSNRIPALGPEILEEASHVTYMGLDL